MNDLNLKKFCKGKKYTQKMHAVEDFITNEGADANV
jgi:hypothetical protein